MFKLTSYYDFTSPWYTPSNGSEHYEQQQQQQFRDLSNKHAITAQSHSLPSSHPTPPESPYDKVYSELYRSMSSSSSESSSSSAEVQTPPASPTALLHWTSRNDGDVSHLVQLNDIKGKGRQLEHDNNVQPSTALPTPSLKQHRRLPLPQPPAVSTVSSSASAPAPQSAVSSLQAHQSYSVTPPSKSAATQLVPPMARSAPNPTSREYEELRRGRSRWPRLLWRSELDSESLDALGTYHARAVGGPLPVLPSVQQARERPGRVGEWSRKMERAGL